MGSLSVPQHIPNWGRIYPNGVFVGAAPFVFCRGPLRGPIWVFVRGRFAAPFRFCRGPLRCNPIGLFGYFQFNPWSVKCSFGHNHRTLRGFLYWSGEKVTLGVSDGYLVTGFVLSEVFMYSGVWLTGQLNWTTRQKIYELSSLAKKKVWVVQFCKKSPIGIGDFFSITKKHNWITRKIMSCPVCNSELSSFAKITYRYRWFFFDHKQIMRALGY